MKRVVVTLTDEAYDAITEHKEGEHSVEITAALLTGLVIEPEEWIKKESLKNKLTALHWTPEAGFDKRYVLDNIIDETPTMKEIDL
jgi:predicted outer membrane protein